MYMFEIGYPRPPRQQNGTSHDDTNNVVHAKAWGTDNANSSRNNNNDNIDNNGSPSTWTTENVATEDWSTDITAQSGSLSAENPAENAKSSWTSDNTDKAQGNRSKENPTDSLQPGWGADNAKHSIKGVRTTDNATENNNKASTDNITTSRDIDKATDVSVTKDNWDTEHSKDNWGVENESWTADTPKDNWGSDNFGSDTTKSGKNAKEVLKSPNTVMRSVAPTKSPVSHSLRTIPLKPKASWAQIVKCVFDHVFIKCYNIVFLIYIYI